MQRELLKNYPPEVIESAITHNPAYAQIPTCEIDKIADEVINLSETAFLEFPLHWEHGGVAMVATIPADLVQYYGYMLRAAQKLMYLYGFPEIDTTEKRAQI